MALNPVEQRLVALCNYWDKFRKDITKRLLLWQVPDNATRMLQCFFEAQKHESEYSTEDLFIVFSTPFENPIQYSRALKETLAGQYDASREDLKQQGIADDWDYTPTEFPDSASGFAQSLRSFGSKHHEIIGHLAAVLMPQSIANDKAYAAWLTRVLDAGLPERLRLVITDSSEHPQLILLAESGHELIYIDTPKIDALTIAQETFAQETTVGPAGVFRNYLMGLVTLIEKGSIGQVKAKSADAFAFARKQKWADQEVVIRMLFAGALLKEKNFDEALKIYQGARESALQAVKSGHPAGQQLVLQTWFGEAGTHFAADDTKQAAKCYDQAAVVAKQIPNAILEIEALRMGAFCHARLDEQDAALMRGTKIFACALQLNPEARAMTTMPIAAIDLLRVVDAERVQQMEDIKHHHDMRQEKANEDLEKQVEVIEKSGNTDQLRVTEEKLALEAAQIEKEANDALYELARTGGDKFREVFSQARQLLDQNWPLSTLADVPLPTEDAAS